MVRAKRSSLYVAEGGGHGRRERGGGDGERRVEEEGEEEGEEVGEER